MVADHFADDEIEELFGEVGIEMGVLRKLAQPRDLLRFACRISRRQAMTGLELAHSLGAAEPLGEHMDQRRIDIVDRGAIIRQPRSCRLGIAHGIPPHHFLPLGRPGKPPPGSPGSFMPAPGRPGIPPPAAPGRPLSPAACACFCKASSCLGSIFDRSGMPPIPPMPPPSPILEASPPMAARIMPPPLPLPPMAFIMSAIWRCIFKSLLICAASVPEPLAMRTLRLCLRMSGLTRSAFVIDWMMAICRPNILSSRPAAAIWSFILPMPGIMPMM